MARWGYREAVPHHRLLIPAARLDRVVFDRVARWHTPWLDGTMAAVTRAANFSRLWLAAAAVLALVGGRRGQRAALRGVGSIALTSPIVNLGIKRLVRRPRPSLRNVPAARRLRTQPLTTSFPSGHAASAAAFAVGASAETPRGGMPLGVLAGTVAYSRVYTGVHYPLDVLTGAAIGAGVALITRLQWPVLPPEAEQLPPSRAAVRAPRSPDGEKVGVVVNPKSGTGPLPLDDPLEMVRSRLPRARVLEVDRSDELEDVLHEAAQDAEVLGIHGGDGSAATAAAVAVAHGLPLLLLPGGTLNHLARDLRVESPEEALDALERGEAVRVDLAQIEGSTFVNTVSFGGYIEMIETRRRLESRVGRWPAHLLAVARAIDDRWAEAAPVDGVHRELRVRAGRFCAQLETASRRRPARCAPAER